MAASICSEGDSDGVIELIQEGVDANLVESYTNRTLLHLVAAKGLLEASSVLIQHGT